MLLLSKNFLSKAKKRGASRDVTRELAQYYYVANSIHIIIRGRICPCVLAIDLGFVTRRGFCTLCPDTCISAIDLVHGFVNMHAAQPSVWHFVWIGNYKITVKSALSQKRGHLRQIGELKI